MIRTRYLALAILGLAVVAYLLLAVGHPANVAFAFASFGACVAALIAFTWNIARKESGEDHEH